MQLANKRCLIIGGTGGIGAAAARRFLLEGARVVINGLAEPTESVDRAAVILGDVSDSNEVDKIFRESISVLGGLDVLYHVAGASGRRYGDGPLHECSDAGWQWTIDCNLKSVFLTNRAAVRHYLNFNQPGVILNLSSVLAIAPEPNHFDTAAYTASKGGVISLSRYAASRYAANRIRVNVIAPGLIDTNMSIRAATDPTVREFLRTKQPLAAGPGAPEDCVGAAVFLCSDAAAFITGVVLPVDGGWCVSG